MIISFGFPARALKTIRVGTGYVVWTGIGSMGTATLGMIFFSEPASWMRLGSIGLILAGIIALKATS
jgi:quaternary ammonium compound-resistance protein SugE